MVLNPGSLNISNTLSAGVTNPVRKNKDKEHILKLRFIRPVEDLN